MATAEKKLLVQRRERQLVDYAPDRRKIVSRWYHAIRHDLRNQIKLFANGLDEARAFLAVANFLKPVSISEMKVVLSQDS